MNNEKSLLGKYTLYHNDYLKIENVTSKMVNYTYLGYRRNVTFHLTHNGKKVKKTFIEGYDEIEIFDEIDLQAKVHRFMAMYMFTYCVYLGGPTFKREIYKVDGDNVIVDYDLYTIDGNTNFEEYEGRESLTVPLKIIQGTIEVIKEYIENQKK